MKAKLKNFINKVRAFLRIYGVDAVASFLMWTSPTWLSFFIPELKNFALYWLGLLASPIIPFWVVVPLFAIILHWVRKKVVQFIIFVKDQLNKLKLANELLIYYDKDEFELILDKGKALYKEKKDDLTQFKADQKEKRMELIKDKWEV